ncbi:Uncharacterised protein [Klebsiella pneumoniae]|uniref:hypothetical protein n=1 Tax=Klebsiella pneumoniae TaxID=573 RepID=UPI000E2CF34F|nr:hypothetical protein [Klebsiella pneumoniae]SYC71645.1 Uncharacterised protein [Klebsiella pneumoniae]
MTKSTITKERLEKIVSDPMINQGSEFAMMARMALAAMDSEPVIVVGDDGGDALSYRRLIQSFESGTKLYRHAQPAQVVPDEKDKTVDADDHPLLWSFNEGWNACRAAMLQAGNSPVIPEGYVMVPKEPTEAMINAWLSEVANWRGHVAGYKAMLATAPQEVK